MGRGRASSSASSMSIGLSPARRSTSLDEVALEETPNARRQTGFAMQVAKIKRHRQILGMSGLNGSESDLSITSNGQTTPDLVNQRGLEDDVDALAVDPDHNVHSSPMKESTPAKSTTSPVSPFALKGPVRTASLRLLVTDRPNSSNLLDFFMYRTNSTPRSSTRRPCRKPRSLDLSTPPRISRRGYVLPYPTQDRLQLASDKLATGWASGLHPMQRANPSIGRAGSQRPSKGMESCPVQIRRAMEVIKLVRPHSSHRDPLLLWAKHQLEFPLEGGRGPGRR